MYIDFATLPPDALPKALQKARDAGLSDNDIILIALHQKIQHLRKQQRVYYKTKNKEALREAMYWSEQVDEMLEMLHPLINRLQEQIQKTK